MMIARVKADSREIRSEPPTYASIQEDSEGSDVSSIEGEPAIPGKFIARHTHSQDETSSTGKPDTFTRTVSAQSLPVGNRLMEVAEMSMYDRTLHMLAVDPMYQKEVALGKRIGFYRLGKELGAGNFSKVKLGIHVLTKEKVAVKVMEKTKMDQKAQRLLAREIQSMEKMHHPNIIRLFECVETLTRMHLVLEYAGGGELYVYVHERGKLTEADAKPLFAQIVSAVAHMHSRAIVHRDIKAENIMFAGPGVVKLVDFGFSCLVSSSSDQLATFCGSPPYAAPELFRDQSYNGSMVDIWALGVLLYFMLVGVTPFRGETVQELKAIIMEGKFSVPDYVTTFAQHVIVAMLNMDPEKRPSIEEVKKNHWLRECRFPKSYLTIPIHVEKDDEPNEITKRVWRVMNGFGITEDMLEDASEKGPRNAITGTYRIVQYQVQVESKNKTQTTSEPFPTVSSADVRKRKTTPSLKHRSKTCSVL